jgi:C-terminal processing protease CtpA/Prc
MKPQLPLRIAIGVLACLVPVAALPAQNTQDSSQTQNPNDPTSTQNRSFDYNLLSSQNQQNPNGQAKSQNQPLSDDYQLLSAQNQQNPNDPTKPQTYYYQLLSGQNQPQGRPGHYAWTHFGNPGQFWIASGYTFSGMGLAPVDESLRAHLKLPKGQGLIVTAIEGHSPAAKAGIRQNDVLLKLGETPLGKTEDLEEALKASGDKPVSLSLLRNGRVRPIKVQGRVQVTLGPVEPDAPEFWIGISVSPIEPALRSQLELPQQEGLLILEVMKDSPAAQAGLKAHDIALRLGGKPLTDQGKLIEIVQVNGEKAIPIEVIRQGDRLTINVTPQRRKRSGLTWRVGQPNSFFFDVVRPGVVLSEPLHSLQTLRNAVDPQGRPHPAEQLYEAATVLGNKDAEQKALKETDEAVSKRLEDMAAQIKELRKAIEDLSKATKEEK